MSRPAPRHLKQQPSLVARAVPVVASRRGTALATGAALSVPTSLGGIAFASAADAAGTIAPKSTSVPAASPAPKAAVAATTMPVLRYGATGSSVRTLQSRLGGLSADGSFGPATLRSVKAFQSRKGLSVDGVVGPKTWAALGGGASTSPAPNKCTVTVVRYGSSGALVKTLQGRLRISADGSFGPQTLSAVKSYQRSKGLSADGIVGPKTWSALGGFPCGTGGGGGGGGGGGDTPADPNASYKLPFPSGVSHKITQSPSGTFSHDDRYSKYAIDFGMPTGSTVVASRSGSVYKAGWDSYGGGNSVMVRDASGYCMQYNHLSRINVSRGQSVTQGQRVGNAGSTGNSTGPHLHWGLVTCSGYVSVYVPRSVERGTSYPVGVYARSQNG
jgi:murein DD-endopeptidase MepM/ murein hydrolase activator NlpD